MVLNRLLSILIFVTQESTLRILLSLAIALSISACGHPIEHAHAEITDIKNHSDTSVVVSIEVLRNSNAVSACRFELFVDTIPTIRQRGARVATLTVSNNCNLEKNYEVTVGGLKKEIPYYFQLYTFGSFDMGGPGGGSDKEIGRQLEYTIH